MPRLPGVSAVTRVSTDNLRLPALNAPATDPTGAALQELGQSLGNFGEAFDDFTRKRKRLKETEQSIETREVTASFLHRRATTLPNDRAVSGPDGFFFEDAEEDVVSGASAGGGPAVIGSTETPPLDPVEAFGDTIAQRFTDPAQQKDIEQTIKTEKTYYRFALGVDEQNRRAAGLEPRVNRILARHLETACPTNQPCKRERARKGSRFCTKTRRYWAGPTKHCRRGKRRSNRISIHPSCEAVFRAVRSQPF